MSDLRSTAATRQRTLNFRLRLNLIGTFIVVSHYGWLPRLLDPRRNQYKPELLSCVWSQTLRKLHYRSNFPICQVILIYPFHSFQNYPMKDQVFHLIPLS